MSQKGCGFCEPDSLSERTISSNEHASASCRRHDYHLGTVSLSLGDMWKLLITYPARKLKRFRNLYLRSIVDCSGALLSVSIYGKRRDLRLSKMDLKWIMFIFTSSQAHPMMKDTVKLCDGVETNSRR